MALRSKLLRHQGNARAAALEQAYGAAALQDLLTPPLPVSTTFVWSHEAFLLLRGAYARLLVDFVTAPQPTGPGTAAATTAVEATRVAGAGSVFDRGSWHDDHYDDHDPDLHRHDDRHSHRGAGVNRGRGGDRGRAWTPAVAESNRPYTVAGSGLQELTEWLRRALPLAAAPALESIARGWASWINPAKSPASSRPSPIASEEGARAPTASGMRLRGDAFQRHRDAAGREGAAAARALVEMARAEAGALR